VAGIGTASFLADVGHETPTALLPNLLTATLGASAAALGLIEGVSDGLADATRLAGGLWPSAPGRPPGLCRGKEPFSWAVVRRADGWAQAQGWQPGPSDA
jgi:hypothetical protein